MDSRVYYGEYSLKHWIKMMLSRNIILPEYQRSFVWEEKDVRRLVDSIHHGQFVQPVTIALYKVDEGMPGQNLIIDGQQRLSSILLAYLGYMPDKNKFEKPEILASDEDDAADEALDETTRRGPIKWRFGELFEDGGDNNEGAIRKRMERTSVQREEGAVRKGYYSAIDGSGRAFSADGMELQGVSVLQRTLAGCGE